MAHTYSQLNHGLRTNNLDLARRLHDKNGSKTKEVIRMNKLKSTAIVLATLATISTMWQTAKADVMYTFDTYTGSGIPPSSPYGTVNLHQNGANVDVTVTLTPGMGFVNTGAGAALTWDLNGEPVVTIENLNLTNFFVSHNGTATGNLDGTGSWFYEIDCTLIGCGSGGNFPNPGPLTFTIDNITTNDFAINNKTSTGYLFASDICTQIGRDDTCAGITGDIATSNIPVVPINPTSIPEPATLLLACAGLLSLSALRRQQRGNG